MIDDECDYFVSDINRWLFKKERDVFKKKEDEFREKRYGLRREIKVIFDFVGRKVIDEGELEVDYDFNFDVVVFVFGFYSLDRNIE